MISPAVQRALATLHHERGPMYALDDLIASVECWRQRTMHIATTELPADMTGFAITLRDCDVIWVCTRLDPILRQRTILHELAHFFLGHLEVPPATTPLPSYETFCQRWQQHLPYALCRKRFATVAHNTPNEQDAELLALLLQKGIRAYETQTPSYIQHIYGS